MWLSGESAITQTMIIIQLFSSFILLKKWEKQTKKKTKPDFLQLLHICDGMENTRQKRRKPNFVFDMPSNLIDSIKKMSFHFFCTHTLFQRFISKMRFFLYFYAKLTLRNSPPLRKTGIFVFIFLCCLESEGHEKSESNQVCVFDDVIEKSDLQPNNW